VQVAVGCEAEHVGNASRVEREQRESTRPAPSEVGGRVEEREIDRKKCRGRARERDVLDGFARGMRAPPAVADYA